MLDNYIWFDDNNIKIGFFEHDRQFVHGTSTSLKEAIKFLSVYFLLKTGFPPIRAMLAPNRKEYDRLVKELLKVDIENPSKPNRIAQPQRTDLVLLAPSAYAIDSIFTYSVMEYKRLIFHETTHMFEEYLSPNIEASPRWWSEGLAVYLSGQWEYEDDFRIPVLEGIKSKNIPAIKEIAKDINLSYQWGWTIVKYVEHIYGSKMIRTIVANCVEGDVFKIIGEKIGVFERKWKKYLHDGKDIFNVDKGKQHGPNS